MASDAVVDQGKSKKSEVVTPALRPRRTRQCPGPCVLARGLPTRINRETFHWPALNYYDAAALAIALAFCSCEHWTPLADTLLKTKKKKKKKLTPGCQAATRQTPAGRENVDLDVNFTSVPRARPHPSHDL